MAQTLAWTLSSTLDSTLSRRFTSLPRMPGQGRPRTHPA
jgi:hypothetical protein